MAIARHSSAAWLGITETVAKSSLYFHGNVAKVMSDGLMPVMLRARSFSASGFASEGSVVRDFAVADNTDSNCAGFVMTPTEVAFLMAEDRNSCWRSMRERSLPSPTCLRARTNASACSPRTVVTGCQVQLRVLVVDVFFKQTSTPSSALTTSLKPVKSTTT